MSNLSSQLIYPIDEATLYYYSHLNLISLNLSFISGWILGNFTSLGHSWRLNCSRDFNIKFRGRIWSFLQQSRPHFLSFSWNPKDSWISTKFLQEKSSNVSKFGVHISGNFVINSQHLRLTSFKSLNWNPVEKKKKNQNLISTNI